MTGYIASNLIAYGGAGLVLIAVPVALKGLNAGYLHPIPSGLTLRRPWVQCACFGMMALLCLLLPLEVAADDLRFYGAVRADTQPFFWAFACIGIAGASLFLWLGKPQELVLDQKRRTYRYTDGWPPYQRVRTGPWSDLEGVGAEESVSTNNGYLVYIHWRCGPRQHKMVVGRFRSVERADGCARELASKLGLLIIPMPRPYWS